jgi:copper(I)-binding protein
MRKHRLQLVAASAAVALLAAGCAGDGGEEAEGNAPVIHVAGAWARSPMEGVAAVYFTMHNGGGAADTLVGVSTPVAPRSMRPSSKTVRP